jgi:hypothetical protein
MNIEPQIKLMQEIQTLFAKMYRMELSARVREGIKVKKERSLHVKKSKV